MLFCRTLFFLYFFLYLPCTIFIRCNYVTKPIEAQLHFFHYSRSNPNSSVELTIGQKLPVSINPKHKWKFFIHGWTTNPAKSPWFYTGKDAYFARGEFNIIFVDWSKAASLSYVDSVQRAEASGKYMADFIITLLANNVAPKDIHLLGHSLGSHMAGFAGKYLYRSCGKKIGRITGLDPAGPIYESGPFVPFVKPFLLPADQRLSKNDARFVDITHTDSGMYGMKSSIGHIDFYPNGGTRKQSGCELSEDSNCSHAKSTLFYVESINAFGFIATKCYSYQAYKRGYCHRKPKCIYGEHVDKYANLRGKFYFLTNPAPPFAQDH